ncbi:MAG: Flp family type IVb pilin [Proteobacteria bacterium]|jgi:pilus assembly protein Flp/PilA|nr:Flp family type IVb pilin [Pseudomonadota bacterium]
MRRRRGATAIEYGLLSALIAVAGVGAFYALGTQLTAVMVMIAGVLGGDLQDFGYWSGYDDGDGYFTYDEIDAMITDDLPAFSGFPGGGYWLDGGQPRRWPEWR